jgi:hypothetical protein
MKLLKTANGITRKYLVSILILSSVFLAMIVITLRVYPNGLPGILIATVMVLFFGFGKIGINENNVSDYLETNKESFVVPEEKVKEVLFQ